jgi:hypothetical protein
MASACGERYLCCRSICRAISRWIHRILAYTQAHRTVATVEPFHIGWATQVPNHRLCDLFWTYYRLLGSYTVLRLFFPDGASSGVALADSFYNVCTIKPDCRREAASFERFGGMIDSLTPLKSQKNTGKTHNFTPENANKILILINFAAIDGIPPSPPGGWPRTLSNLISVVPSGLLLIGSFIPRTFLLGYSRFSLREKEAAKSGFPPKQSLDGAPAYGSWPSRSLFPALLRSQERTSFR